MTTRQLNHAFPVIRGDVITQSIPMRFGEMRTSIRMEIHNTMRVGVFWKNAHGALFVEAPSLNVTGDECLHITFEYELSRSVKFDARELSNELIHDPARVERKRLLEGFTELYNKIQAGGTPPYKLNYTVVLPRSILEDNGGVIYLNDCDLVVGFASEIDQATHPFTLNGTRESLTKLTGEMRGAFTGYLLIDNAGRHGSRWLNDGINVTELIPDRNNTLADGVYVSFRTRPRGRSEVVFKTLDEAEKEWGLYRTRGEAESYGDPVARHQQAMKSLEQEVQLLKLDAARQQQEWDHELERLKIETAREKHLLDKEKRELESDKNKLEREKERLNFQREQYREEREMWTERQKFDLDSKSREQKSQVDSVKLIGDLLKATLGLVTVGLTIYAASQKFKSNK